MYFWSLNFACDAEIQKVYLSSSIKLESTRKEFKNQGCDKPQKIFVDKAVGSDFVPSKIDDEICFNEWTIKAFGHNLLLCLM